MPHPTMPRITAIRPASTASRLSPATATVASRTAAAPAVAAWWMMAVPGTVQINFFYFPGWVVTVDGLPVADPAVPDRRRFW